jgi:hypothetical protein
LLAYIYFSFELKSKVYEDRSKNDLDKLRVDKEMLDFVSDGLNFDPQVIKSTAAYTLPYKSDYIKEVFRNKDQLGDDFHVDPKKYKFSYLNIKPLKRPDKTKPPPRNPYQEMVLYEDIEGETLSSVPLADIRFKSRNAFEEFKSLSASDGELNATQRNVKKMTNAQSLTAVDDQQGFFLTETRHYESHQPGDSIQTDSDKPVKKKQAVKSRKQRAKADELKEIHHIDWDEFLINSLSENTARWIVMKVINEREFFFQVLLVKFVILKSSFHFFFYIIMCCFVVYKYFSFNSETKTQVVSNCRREIRSIYKRH